MRIWSFWMMWVPRIRRKKPQLSRTFFLFRCFFFLEAFFDDKDDERASRNKQGWKITDTSYKLLWDLRWTPFCFAVFLQVKVTCRMARLWTGQGIAWIIQRGSNQIHIHLDRPCHVPTCITPLVICQMALLWTPQGMRWIILKGCNQTCMLLAHHCPSQWLCCFNSFLSWIHSLKLTAKAPENRPNRKRKRSYSYHPFSGAMLVSGRVIGIILSFGFCVLKDFCVAYHNVTTNFWPIFRHWEVAELWLFSPQGYCIKNCLPLHIYHRLRLILRMWAT